MSRLRHFIISITSTSLDVHHLVLNAPAPSLSAFASRLQGAVLGIQKSVFSSIELEVEVESPNVELEVLQKIVAEHQCSVLCNLSRVSAISTSAVLL